jgi:hypothetical protein
MPIYKGVKPEISSGYGRRDSGFHYGVDIMYPRATRGKAQYPEYTQGYFCPSGIIPFLSVGPGKVHSASWRNDRWIVTVDHSRVPGFGPLCTVYIHGERATVKKGDIVAPGSVLGIVGETGTDINHLHHSWWFTAAGTSRENGWARDPEPYLKLCGFMTWSGPGSAGVPDVMGGAGTPPAYPGGGGMSADDVKAPGLRAVDLDEIMDRIYWEIERGSDMDAPGHGPILGASELMLPGAP